MLLIFSINSYANLENLSQNIIFQFKKKTIFNKKNLRIYKYKYLKAQYFDRNLSINTILMNKKKIEGCKKSIVKT